MLLRLTCPRRPAVSVRVCCAQMAQVLAGAGVLRLATLEDGSRWVLPASQHLAHAAAAWPGVTQVGLGVLRGTRYAGCCAAAHGAAAALLRVTQVGAMQHGRPSDFFTVGM